MRLTQRGFAPSFESTFFVLGRKSFIFQTSIGATGLAFAQKAGPGKKFFSFVKLA